MDLKEVVNKLEAMEKKIQRKAVRTAAKSAAKVLLEEAKARVPVKTGNLKKSLGINTRTKKGNIIVYVSPREGKKAKYDGFYGRFVELGHILREKGKGRNGKVIGHVPPKPFLRPAFETKGEEAIKVFVKTLKEEVNKLG
jgi:HK97 gp10 family phage protein